MSIEDFASTSSVEFRSTRTGVAARSYRGNRPLRRPGRSGSVPAASLQPSKSGRERPRGWALWLHYGGQFRQPWGPFAPFLAGFLQGCQARTWIQCRLLPDWVVGARVHGPGRISHGRRRNSHPAWGGPLDSGRSRFRRRSLWRARTVPRSPKQSVGRWNWEVRKRDCGAGVLFSRGPLPRPRAGPEGFGSHQRPNRTRFHWGCACLDVCGFCDVTQTECE